MDLELFAGLLSEHPYQFAVEFFRTFELSCILRNSIPEGLGLDLGCGDGLITRQILSRANAADRTLVGLDIEPAETQLAEDLGQYARIHTCPADAIPEPDDIFDFVLSVCVLEHIPNLSGVFAEVSRVLKPGGMFLFSVPSMSMHECLRGSLLPWRSREKYLKIFDERNAHEHYFSVPETTESLNRNGLELVQVFPFLTPEQLRRWETLSRFTGGILYALAGNKPSRRPVTIQRKLGMRKKNSLMLPLGLSRVLAGILKMGCPVDAEASLDNAGCFYFIARKIGD